MVRSRESPVTKAQSCWIVCKGLSTIIPALIITVLLILFARYHRFPEGESRQGDINASSFRDSSVPQWVPLAGKRNCSQVECYIPTTQEDIDELVKFDDNVYMSMVDKYSGIFNLSDCYVCTHFPTSTSDPMPFVAAPLSGIISCTFFQEMLLRAARTSLVVNKRHQQTQRIQKPSCTSNNYSASDSFMLTHFPRIPRAGLTNRTLGNTEYLRTGHEIIHLKMEKGRMGNLCIRVKEPEIKPTIRFRTFHLGETKGPKQIAMGKSECKRYINLHYSSSTSPEMIGYKGIYFVCGSAAYFHLPAGWYGSCYIAFVLPRVTHMAELPREIFRTKRAANLDWLWDILGVMIPPVGFIANSMSITKVATLIENLATDTGYALGNITEEMTAIRTAVLQNRMALDIILAKEGGVCHLLHQKCCVYIPDNSGKVKKAISSIHKVAKEAQDISSESMWSSLGSWLSSWFGSWGASILKIFLLGLALLVVGCVVIQILPSCLSNFCQAIGQVTRPKEKESVYAEMEKIYHLSTAAPEEFELTEQETQLGELVLPREDPWEGKELEEKGGTEEE